MNCAHCNEPMTGRKRKYCAPTCCKRAQPKQILTGECDEDGCLKPRKAKGLCSTHYNSTRPNRHRKMVVTCSQCGQEAMKDLRNTRRYARQFCSTQCRDDAIRKVWPSSLLPEDHWARWYGRTSTWTAPALKATFFSGRCNDCDAAFIERAYGVPSDYCSTLCTKRAGRRRRRAREHNAPGDFTFTQVMRQYVQQGSACAYCKQPSVGLPDPEHVTPLSRGGRNDMSNLVAACRPCNADKNDLTLDEWAHDRARRGLPAVDTTLTGAAYAHLWLTEPTQPAWRDRIDLRQSA